MERQGNRSPEAAPQGLYPCEGHQLSENPQWLALSVATEGQWQALIGWLGRPRPDWAAGIAGDLLSRRAAHDTIDRHLKRVFAVRKLESCIEELVALGVPVARVVDPRTLTLHPQYQARNFMEEVEHPVIGRQSTMTVPFRYTSVRSWLERAAPTLGQHNAEILRGLGYTDNEIAALAAQKVIGDRPEGL